MSARAQGQLLLSLPWSASSRAVQGEAADWEGGGGALEGVFFKKVMFSIVLSYICKHISLYRRKSAPFFCLRKAKLRVTYAKSTQAKHQSIMEAKQNMEGDANK